MDSAVIVAIVTGAFSVLAVIITNNKSNREVSSKLDMQHAVLEERMTQEIGALRKEVERHNNVISRTFNLESKMEVIEEKIKVASKRIDNLERSGK